MAAIAAFHAVADGALTGEAMLFSAWPTSDLRPFGWDLMATRPCISSRPERRRGQLPPSCASTRFATWKDSSPGSALQSTASPSRCRRERRRSRSSMSRGWPIRAAACGSAGSTTGQTAPRRPGPHTGSTTSPCSPPSRKRAAAGMAKRSRGAAQADPSLPAMLFSSDDGRPIYDRMGFLSLTRLTLWHRARGGAGGG